MAEGCRVGGTFVICGCVPKKLMHDGAHFAEAFKHARGYGWGLDRTPSLDFRALLQARNISGGMLERAGGRVPLTAASGPVSGGRGSRIRSRGR